MTFRSLFCDVKADPTAPDQLQSFVSIGRVTFWLLMCFMCYFWIQGIPIPASLIETFNIIILYNFLKKPLDMIDSEAIKSWIKKS